MDQKLLTWLEQFFFSDLVGAVNRPKAWPSFAIQASEIILALSNIHSWKIHLETAETNYSVFLIAQSATVVG